MRKIDYHMHTHFSGDSEASPREHIEQAISVGLDEICFTDHRDFDYPIDTFDLDTDAYFMELSALKNEYVDRITIKIGVEVVVFSQTIGKPSGKQHLPAKQKSPDKIVSTEQRFYQGFFSS